MDSHDKKFKEILEYLKEPHTGVHEGDRAICYLTFPPSEMLSIKRKVPAWVSMANHSDFSIAVISMAEVINQFFINHPNRKNWLQYEQVEEKWEMEELFQDLSDIVINNQVIERAILELQEKIKNKKGQVMMITDIEALHPYTRFGPIEQKIYSKIEIPVIVLYPGNISGSALEFLGFYPPDGNYRSKHF